MGFRDFRVQDTFIVEYYLFCVPLFLHIVSLFQAITRIRISTDTFWPKCCLNPVDYIIDLELRKTQPVKATDFSTSCSNAAKVFYEEIFIVWFAFTS